MTSIERYAAKIEPVGDRAVKVQFTDAEVDRTLSNRDVHMRWADDEAFCAQFSRTLAEAPMRAFFWETPQLSARSIDRPFECVLTPAPRLAFLLADPRPFRRLFAAADATAEVVAFSSLGGDADLIAPRDTGEGADHAHLAGFLRTAAPAQTRALWRMVAATAEAWAAHGQACWISTSGLGVAWVHVRIDSRPKYYTHTPYRTP